MSDHDEQGQQGPTVRDRRRIDPETFQVREPQSAAAPGPEAPAAEAAQRTRRHGGGRAGAAAQTALAERTADLQRLQAEYVNYKRRVDRDRDLTRKVALEGFVKDFLPVLDDVRSAREHGELTGAFKAVGEAGRADDRPSTGWRASATKGDPFDPHIHEALMQVPAGGCRRTDLRRDPAARLPDRRAGAAPGAGRGGRAGRRRGPGRGGGRAGPRRGGWSTRGRCGAVTG